MTNVVKKWVKKLSVGQIIIDLQGSGSEGSGFQSRGCWLPVEGSVYGFWVSGRSGILRTSTRTTKDDWLYRTPTRPRPRLLGG